MASGPALKKAHSHAAIHEAALNEARELNEIMAMLLKDGKEEQAMETALITLEHWETRTLRHADSEEEGLYKELVEEDPDLKDSILELTRDHNIMRDLAKDIKEKLENEGMSEEILELFHTLVHVDAFHNKEEERLLPEH